MKSHRSLITAVIILVIINIVWLVSSLRPYDEWPGFFDLKSLERPDLQDSITDSNKDSLIIINQHFIQFKKFHHYLDSLAVLKLPAGLPVPGELVLVAANPWIADTLRMTDYRAGLKRGIMIDDLDEAGIIPPGVQIIIPDSVQAFLIARSLLSTRLVMNIPEFRARLIRDGDTLLVAPVRVGRNEKVFLEAIGQEVDLRTPVGKGRIVRVWRRPKSVNLHTGEVYKFTRRDDGRVTRMPAVPSLEPEINGKRTGKMIHATTNPVTLGSAYSHGCVGVSEADMWIIYFNMPAGAEVEFRYDLKSGDTVYRDIYKRGS